MYKCRSCDIVLGHVIHTISHVILLAVATGDKNGLLVNTAYCLGLDWVCLLLMSAF